MTGFPLVRRSCFAAAALLALLGPPSSAHAEGRRITYQGRLTGVTPAEVKAVRVRIYASPLSDAALLWGGSAGERHEIQWPAGTDGSFSIVVGVTDLDLQKPGAGGNLVVGTDGVPDLDQLSPSKPWYLDLIVEKTSGTSVQLTPRERLFPAFHAFSADIPNGAVGAAQLGPNAVSSEKIQDGTITSADIRDGTITGPKLTTVDSQGLTGANIKNGSITAEDLAPELQPVPDIRVRLRRTTFQTSLFMVPTSEPINWDQELYDIGGLHDNDNPANRSRLTAPRAGTYLITASIIVGRQISVILKLQCYFLGAQAGNSECAASSVNAVPPYDRVSTSTVIHFNAGDYVIAYVYRQSVGGYITSGEALMPSIDMTLLR